MTSPPKKKADLIKQFGTLTQELSFLKKHYKTGSDEYDRRLEIIFLKARTLKLITQCEIGIVADKYANERDEIKGLCGDIFDLHNIELDYKTSTSKDLVEYRTKLANLESKVEARFSDADTIHFE